MNERRKRANQNGFAVRGLQLEASQKQLLHEIGQESARGSLSDVCGARKQPMEGRTNIILMTRVCSQESKCC